MKNIITILCLIVFAGSAFAQVYELPGSRVETVTKSEVTVQEGTQQVSQTKTTRKWFRRRHKDPNPTNTYWNFGRPPFWTGSI